MLLEFYLFIICSFELLFMMQKKMMAKAETITFVNAWLILAFVQLALDAA